VISAQEEWRQHLTSCAVCHNAPSGDVAALCNRGKLIWAQIVAEPPPVATLFGSRPMALAPIDDTQPMPVRVRR
jgi:DNA-binding helix-hairpin-helix protein with protein kinase domain